MFPETLRMTAPILVWNRDSLPKELEEFMYQNASPILIDGLDWVAVVDFDFFRQMGGYINLLGCGANLKRKDLS